MRNISQACIKVRDPHRIEISVINAPKNQKIAALEKRIELLESAGVDWETVNVKIVEKLNELDIVQKTDLLNILENYLTVEAADKRYQPLGEYIIRKNVSLDEYNALGTNTDKNTLYIID